MTSTTLRSSTFRACRASSAMFTTPLVIIFILLWVTETTSRQSNAPFFAFAGAAAAAPPTQFQTKNHLLNLIGNKFESTAIATHNTIIQKVKEEYDDVLPLSASSPLVDDLGLSSSLVTEVRPTTTPTSSSWINGVDTGSAMLAGDPTGMPSATVSNLDNVKEAREISSIPSLSPTLLSSSIVPSLVPSQSLTVDNTSTKTTAIYDQDCPDLFDKAAFYVENDVVSTQGPLFCRNEGCRITYRCQVQAFCNVVVPGKEYSGDGWVEIGYCGRNNNLISMKEEHGEGVEPTSHPTSWKFGFHDAALSSAPEDDQDTAREEISSVVDIPTIICDISLSTTLTENFEQTQVLLVVMTKSIHDIFESNLSEELHGLSGISLNVSNEKSNSSSSTTRLHASFTGTASFSHFAPTQAELIELLLLHFDVLEFNEQLKFPLRLRTLDEQEVKVNSVFFTLEDGSVVNAGYEREELALPITVSDGTKGGLTLRHIQIIAVVFVVAALPFVLVALVLVILRYFDKEEMGYLQADDEYVDDSVKPEEVEDASPPVVAAQHGEPVIVAIEPSIKLEIDVPSTPSVKIPLSDISESQSEWSSICSSIHDYARDIESPAKIKTGLGITAVDHHYCRKSTPYDGQVDAIDLMSALWDHRDDPEVYEDYIIDV